MASGRCLASEKRGKWLAAHRQLAHRLWPQAVIAPEPVPILLRGSASADSGRSQAASVMLLDLWQVCLERVPRPRPGRAPDHRGHQINLQLCL